MVQQSLVEYIRKLLEAGYGEGAIRNTLLNAGYNPADIAVAFRVAGHRRVVSTKSLVIVFVVLSVLVISVLGVMKLIQPSEIELSMSLKPLTTTLRAGDDLFVTVNIDNPSGRRVEVALEYRVIGVEGPVLVKSDSVQVRDRLSLPVTLTLPDPLPVGAYTFTVDLSYGPYRKTNTIRLAIVEHEVQFPMPVESLEVLGRERAVAAQLECPLGCDDANTCTNDICISGVCEHTTIAPCCGNFECEADESESDCAVDCGARQESPDDVIDRASSQAGSNVLLALDSCSSLGQRFYVDRCFSKVAESGDDKEACALIVDEEKMNACYMGFAYKRDFTVCDRITNPYMQNSCTGLRSLAGIES